MKVEFELDKLTKTADESPVHLKLCGITGIPFLTMRINGIDYCVKDEDLETLAVNILKALKSKRLSA